MSKFLCEVRDEIKARLRSWTAELEDLERAEDRIKELRSLIQEANEELESVCARIPKPDPEKTE